MKTIIVSKGEGTPTSDVSDVIELCVIQISERIPDYNCKDWAKQSLVFYEQQATVIVDALQFHLPGGTTDAVLRELCKRKACLFRVPI